MDSADTDKVVLIRLPPLVIVRDSPNCIFAAEQFGGTGSVDDGDRAAIGVFDLSQQPPCTRSMLAKLVDSSSIADR
jgi:hypothetical protein